MPFTRALTVLAVAIAAGTVGSAVLIGTSADGSTLETPIAPAAPAAAAAPDAAAPAPLSLPKETLHLPAPLHLVNITTGAVRVDSTHTVFAANLTKPKSSKTVGTAVYTCTTVTSGNVHFSCHSALALRGGVLVFDETRDVSSHSITGIIRGGTGKYDGAQGSISGRDLGGGKDKLTVKYSFS